VNIRRCRQCPPLTYSASYSCDGTLSESCDPSRSYPSITNILNNAGRSDLVGYMMTYMVSTSESSEAFWENEWSTHGTCYSTLAPGCISSGATGQDVSSPSFVLKGKGADAYDALITSRPWTFSIRLSMCSRWEYNFSAYRWSRYLLAHKNWFSDPPDI
jgi:Ribonuclease T2 family